MDVKRMIVGRSVRERLALILLATAALWCGSLPGAWAQTPCDPDWTLIETPQEGSIAAAEDGCHISVRGMANRLYYGNAYHLSRRYSSPVMSVRAELTFAGDDGVPGRLELFSDQVPRNPGETCFPFEVSEHANGQGIALSLYGDRLAAFLGHPQVLGVHPEPRYPGELYTVLAILRGLDVVAQSYFVPPLPMHERGLLALGIAEVGPRLWRITATATFADRSGVATVVLTGAPPAGANEVGVAAVTAPRLACIPSGINRHFVVHRVEAR